jgi:hypothetical protein
MSKKKLGIVALLATLALVLPLSVAAHADTSLNIPLNNNTADPGVDCPATGTYWHFVISPNNGHSTFITFHLNLGDATTYDTSIFLPNGAQDDNVFVAVPAGKTLTSLITAGSSADITWDGIGQAPEKFQLSHTCPGQAQDLTVTKTATPTFTRTFDWTIDKSADKETVYSAGGGESGAVHYKIAVTKTTTDSDWAVSGTITVTNPNSFAVNGVVVSDATLGGTCTVTGSPLNIGANSSAGATYTCTFASNPVSGTNTATATWLDIGSPSTSAVGTAAYTFGDPTTVVGFDTIHVTDTNGGSWEFTDSGSVEYDKTFTGDPVGTCTKHENTAAITETGAQDSVTVQDCQGADLTVEKTAAGSFDRAYGWTIDKSVDKKYVEIQTNGGTATFNYTVKATHTAGTDSNFAVTGKITVSNPNDWQDITADVTDAIPTGNCTVTGGDDVVIPAGKAITLDYSCTFASNPGSGTNTATATWDKNAAHTPNGSDDGTAGFTFGTPTTVTDECVTLDDTFGLHNTPGTKTTFGVACVDDNPTFAKDLSNNLANFAESYAAGTRTFTLTYSRTVSAPALGGCDTYDNTATFTTNDTKTTGSDSESVKVCRFNAPLTIGYWKTHLAKTGTVGWCTGLPTGTGCSNNGPWVKDLLGKTICDNCTVGKLGTYTVDTSLKAANVFNANNCSNASTLDANAAACLAAQLLAAQLNVANGANTCICDTIKEAKAFLTAVNYNGPGQPVTFNATYTRAKAIELKTRLDNYNNNLGCPAPPV